MKKTQKFSEFIKRNSAYFVLALCIIAVGLSITFAVINAPNLSENGSGAIDVVDPTPEGPSDPVVDPTPSEPSTPVVETITFIMPVASPERTSVYSDTLVFNGTLGRYSSHSGIDFFADEGTPVYAVYGGVIESVTNDVIKGVTVIIDHGKGLKTLYNSLADGIEIEVGQVVAKGDIIGEVSTSNRQEYKDGAHLHFEVFENGESIDPVKYLTIDEK
ncbi:MAG: M23 family metallopeptidase [Clostridiales bacterium]|nr:M23 family metallopeptidase [Clostridiales bacterium]